MAAPLASSKTSNKGQWKEKHELEIGFLPTKWDLKGIVEEVTCKFCTSFGREKAALVERKRKKTQKIHTFKTSRIDSLKEHVKNHHPVKNEEYQGLSTRDKKEFFTENTENGPPPTPTPTPTRGFKIPRQKSK